ncbi:MAG: ABC transporter permease [Solirubrobacterales bacterium]|nr:ABC transporter permease [Solirubrobacterales bacterium]OJU96273.1 MAG: nitrate ABC transporter permease [Solirubrobacterales bacterium 67-14]
MFARGTRARRIAAAVLPPVLFAIFVLGVWQLYTVVGDIKESTLPPPTDIAKSLWENRSMLIDNAWVTIKEILLGFAAAIVLGVGLAVLIRSSRKVERAIYPWLVVSQMVPIPAIAPLLVIWTGFDLRPKVIVIMLVSFFPIAVNTIDGLRAAEPELLNLLKTLKANSWQRFRKAQLPAALPFMFSGLKVAAALSVIGAVFAEWVGASEGLGYLVLVLNNQTATTEMFAVIFTLALIGILLFLFVSLLERVLLPWYYESRETEGEGLHLEVEENA